jgi:4-amino-4-deoxy-L-arabinose transferase-like glycosyltransferase
VKALKGLFLLALVLLVFEPGRVPLFEPDEGRYSEIPREMIATGDWVVPHLNGVLYFEKPPLHYWAVAASFSLFGETEFAARVPVKLASVGLALLAFLFARKRWGETVGLLAGLITATSALVVAMARITIIDPGFSLALSAAVFAFAAYAEADAAGDRRAGRRALYGLHVACAAAVMLKGLAGIVLPGGAIVVWVLLTGRWRVLPKLFSPLPLLAFLALTVPWHVAVARREPDFLAFYFVHEHFQRFATSEARRPGQPLYFVGVLLGGFLPWTPFLGRLAGAWPGRRLAEWRSRPTEAFLWSWSILVFLFFSASKSKLIPYVEPIWPAVAVLLAIGIERARERGATFRFERWALGVLLALMAGLGTAFAWGGGTAERLGIGPGAAVGIAALAAGALLAILQAQGFAGGGRPRTAGAFALPVAGPWLLLLASALALLPGVARSVTPWPLVQKLEETLKPDDLLVQRGHYLQAATFYTRRITPVFRLGWHELNFGAERTKDPTLFPSDAEFTRLWNGPKRVVAIVHRDWIRSWADPSLGLTPPLLLAKTPSEKHFLLANRP